MKTAYKVLAIFSLLAIFVLSLVPSAKAFDSRAGETLVIEADEVIDDDLYASANEFTLNGTVKGDLIVFGTFITINGTVEGDLIAAGQNIIINGKVADDARIAGAILLIGEAASIGDDLVAAGASVELQDQTQVGGDFAGAAAQILLAGNIAEDVFAGTGALEIRGDIGGDVKVEVGDPSEDAGEAAPPMSMFFPGSKISMPSIPPGLTISKNASIKGDLEYTHAKKLNLPEGVVGGNVTYKKPVANPSAVVAKPTPRQAALNWVFDLLRSIVTLSLVGMLLAWLFPAFMQTLMNRVQTKAAASLGWGVVSYAAFFFALFILLVAIIIGGVIFNALTLGGIAATIIWLGVFAIFGLIILFVLAAAFFTKITVAWLGGKLLLSKLNPELAEHKFAPLILGVVILATLMALPYIGWLFSLLAVLLGLGAIWMWGSESWQGKKTAPEVIQA